LKQGCDDGWQVLLHDPITVFFKRRCYQARQTLNSPDHRLALSQVVSHLSIRKFTKYEENARFSAQHNQSLTGIRLQNPSYGFL
jgi:hypothetical protein